MSTEENMAVMRRFIEELCNQADLAVADEVLASDFLHRTPVADISGPDGFKEWMVYVRASFPDWHNEIEDMLAVEDKVVTRLTLSGTHEKEFMGIPATGKRAATASIVITRFEGGKPAEDWEVADVFSFYQQLGVIPPLGESEG